SAVCHAMSVTHASRPSRVVPGFGFARASPILDREFSQVAAHVIPIGSVPAGRRHSGIEVVCSREMPLAHEGTFDAPIMQPLPYGVNGISQRHTVAPYAVRVGIKSAPNRGASGSTNG